MLALDAAGVCETGRAGGFGAAPFAMEDGRAGGAACTSNPSVSGRLRSRKIHVVEDPFLQVDLAAVLEALVLFR